MAELSFLSVLLLVVVPPAALACNSFSPSNMSDSPSSQCCDNFAAVFGDNNAICVYCLIDNHSVIGFPKLMPLASINPVREKEGEESSSLESLFPVFGDNNAICVYFLVDNHSVIGFPKLMLLASSNPVREKEGEESSSLESPFPGYHENPAPQELGSSLPPSFDADDKPSLAAQATRSASSSATAVMWDYFCQCFLCSALFGHVVTRTEDQSPEDESPEIPCSRENNQPEMPQLEENNIHDVDDEIEPEMPQLEENNIHYVDDVPRVIPIYRLIENVDTLVATVNITGCVGFTGFSYALQLSHPNWDFAHDWNTCVLWPWRADRMTYIAENEEVLNPLERTWIDFSQHLNWIRVNEIRVNEQGGEPSIGLMFERLHPQAELVFDSLLPRRYIINSRSFVVAVHYAWAAWKSVEPLNFDQVEEARIANQAHIHYFNMDNLALLPPPLLPPPDDLEDWNHFITALSHISIITDQLVMHFCVDFNLKLVSQKQDAS